MAALAIGGAKAASTTNYSDQWWAQNESGWALSVQQQADVLFVSLLVYGTDGKPTWFTATAPLQQGSDPGHMAFTGDLYLTNGPHFATRWSNVCGRTAGGRRGSGCCACSCAAACYRT